MGKVRGVMEGVMGACSSKRGEWVSTPIRDRSCEEVVLREVRWWGIGLKAEYWLGQWGWQEGGQNAGRALGGGWGWKGQLGWWLCREGAGMMVGAPVVFVLEEGSLGRGSRLAVIEGMSMRYGRRS